MPPPQPGPPVLFGTDAPTREASRGPDFLRIGWDAVAGGVRYDLVFDGSVMTNQSPGLTTSGLPPRSGHTVSVRVFDSAGASSESVSNVLTTRPLTSGPPYVIDMPPVQPEGRGVFTLEVDYDEVTPSAGPALSYDIEVEDPGGTFPTAIISGLPHRTVVGPVLSSGGSLGPNLRVILRVRAVSPDASGVSFWSNPFPTATRPPAVPDFSRTSIPFPLMPSLGVVYAWGTVPAFPGMAGGTIEIVQQIAGDTAGVAHDQAGTAAGAWLDAGAASGIGRRTFARTVVDLPGFGRNESPPGDADQSLSLPGNLTTTSNSSTIQRSYLSDYYKTRS